MRQPTSTVVDALLKLQKKSIPTTDHLYVSQEEAAEEAKAGNVNLSLPPEQTVNLVLTLGGMGPKETNKA